MPDLKKPFFGQPPAGPPGPMGNSAGPDDPVTKFLATLLMQEDQRPGDLPSALGAGATMLLPLLPIGKLLKAVKGKSAPITSPTNVGDHMLREHVLGSPRLREFLPVGEEGPAMKDPWEAIIDASGKPRKSPPGSGGGVKHDAPADVHWPSEQDLEALKTRLRTPKDVK